MMHLILKMGTRLRLESNPSVSFGLPCGVRVRERGQAATPPMVRSFRPCSYPAFIKEPARRVEVIHRTEVLVVGSGPGGLAAKAGRELAEVDMAAVQARLEGQRVSLR